MEQARIIKLKVVSGSMSPLIYKGDIILVKLCRASDIKIGDIIFFKISPEEISNKNEKIKYSFIVHRVIDRKSINGKQCFLQKGDALIFGYATVFYEQVKGKVVIIEKKSYNIDLNTLKWKAANRIFAIRAILEYRFGVIFHSVFGFLPKKRIFYFERRLLYVIRKIQDFTLVVFLPFLRTIYKRKQRVILK